ncbi:MAG: hypothetical protein ACD_47C00151G0004 [uncultured bacterium]|nr:MAG: hypothetical protein ACD_47C00151G0004 [uncultured bacterium]
MKALRTDSSVSVSIFFKIASRKTLTRVLTAAFAASILSSGASEFKSSSILSRTAVWPLFFFSSSLSSSFSRVCSVSSSSKSSQAFCA